MLVDACDTRYAGEWVPRLGPRQKEEPIQKTTKAKKGWKYGPSGKTSAQQVQDPDFKSH
jgi:hypothetical protein